MARPVNLNRRREMAARAFEVVRERGVHKTTMSDIAKALEMKRPTLYWYFPDLGAIFKEVYQDLQRDVLHHVSQAMMREKHPIDQLEACLEAAVDYYRRHKDVMAGLLQLWAVGSAEREAWQDESVRVLTPQRDFIIKLIDHGIQKGEVEPCDGEGLADTLLMLIDGANVYSVLQNADPDSMLRFAQKHLLHPLRIPRKDKRAP